MGLSYEGATSECGAEPASAPVATWTMHLADPGLRLAPDAPTSPDAAAVFQARQRQWMSQLLEREDVVEVGAVSVATQAEDAGSQLLLPSYLPKSSVGIHAEDAGSQLRLPSDL